MKNKILVVAAAATSALGVSLFLVNTNCCADQMDCCKPIEAGVGVVLTADLPVATASLTTPTTTEAPVSGAEADATSPGCCEQTCDEQSKTCCGLPCPLPCCKQE